MKKRTIQFGAFELNMETGELRKSGVRMKLQGKAFHILEALVERPGEVVTREELKGRLWPGDTFVDFESGLNTAANRLRLTLGDSAENPRFIETVARTGYRFIGTIAEVAAPVVAEAPVVPALVEHPQTPASGIRRYWLAGFVLAGAAVSMALWIAREHPSQPSFHQISFRRGMLTGGRFGPDGDTILYSARWDGDPSRVFVANSRSPESRALDFRYAKLASVSPTSELALLLAQPSKGFSLSRVPMNGGAPLKVANDVSGADWAPDGKNLAMYRTENRESLIEYPIGKTLYRTAGLISDLRVSPDGEQLAFLEHPLRGDDAGNVRLIDSRGQSKVLSSGWASAGGLAWSPSGREIWFTAGRSGQRRTLYAVTLGGRLREIATVPELVTLCDISKGGRVLLGLDRSRFMMAASLDGDKKERDLSWFDWSRSVAMSKDSKLLLFDETGEGGGVNHSVYLRNLETDTTVRLGDGQALALSPDAQWAVALNQRNPTEVKLLPVGPESPRTISGQGLQYSWVMYFPDGRNFLVVGNYPGKPLRLFVQPVSGGPPVPLNPDVYLTELAISPDGKQIAGNLGHKVVIMPASGGEPRELSIPFHAAPLRWSTDGQSLFLRDMDAGMPAKLSRFDIATSQVHMWKEITPQDSAGWAAFSAFVIGDDEKSYAYSYMRTLSELFVVDGWR